MHAYGLAKQFDALREIARFRHIQEVQAKAVDHQIVNFGLLLSAVVHYRR